VCNDPPPPLTEEAASERAAECRSLQSAAPEMAFNALPKVGLRGDTGHAEVRERGSDRKVISDRQLSGSGTVEVPGVEA
jgi:hypothetical protein